MLNVTFAGDTMTLPDTQLKVGDTLPAAVVTSADLAPVDVATTSGLRVFLTVPSIDTPVCDLEVRTFNTKAAELAGVSIYAISMDLPFAQARWCGAAGISAVTTLSDYKGAAFGHATGAYIQELGLLTRAVFVVDAAGKVVYVQYVPEVTDAPDYDALYACLASLA